MLFLAFLSLLLLLLSTDVSSLSRIHPFCYCYHFSPLRYDCFSYYLVSFLCRYILFCVLTELKFQGACSKVRRFPHCSPFRFWHSHYFAYFFTFFRRIVRTGLKCHTDANFFVIIVRLWTMFSFTVWRLVVSRIFSKCLEKLVLPIIVNPGRRGSRLLRNGSRLLQQVWSLPGLQYSLRKRHIVTNVRHIVTNVTAYLSFSKTSWAEKCGNSLVVWSSHYDTAEDSNILQSCPLQSGKSCRHFEI